ncbi:MAG: DUF4339 domain-containing protein [Methylacidiphilales bacterium]|nr:DUF4339 domain-containing protein [Candidatus Methylacidiphilales bacterium]
MNPGELFYIKRDVKVEGPYDLVKMGDLLLEKSITADTLVRVEGSTDWQPFSKYPQYTVVRETSVDSAVRLDKLNAEAEANAPLIPLPSKQTTINFAVRFFLLLFLGAAAYLAAWYDHTVGTVILLSGIATAMIAHCLILGQVLDEDFSTIGKVSLVPFYDIYYFISNLDKYFSSFFVKYLGMVVAIAAAAGMGELHVHFHH